MLLTGIHLMRMGEVEANLVALRYLFQGGVDLPCTAEGNRLLLDMNGDSALNVTDPVQLLDYLFQNGAPPALGVNCVLIDGCPTVCDE